MQCPGRKALVLDPSVSGPFSMLDASLTDLLTEHGVVKWVGRLVWVCCECDVVDWVEWGGCERSGNLAMLPRASSMPLAWGSARAWCHPRDETRSGTAAESFVYMGFLIGTTIKDKKARKKYVSWSCLRSLCWLTQDCSLRNSNLREVKFGQMAMWVSVDIEAWIEKEDRTEIDPSRTPK